MINVEDVETMGITHEDLSQTARDFAGLIGIPLTLKIIETYGGRSLYIPISSSDDTGLVEVIGRDAAEALAERFGLERINIPLERKLTTKLRNIRLFNRREAGLSASQLSVEFGISQRQVWEILSMGKQHRKGAIR